MKHDGLAGRIALNPYFRGSQFHHLDLKENPNLGIYIPADLHKDTNHNVVTGTGMEEINKLVFEWVIKNYNIDLSEKITSPNYNDFMIISKIIKDKMDLKKGRNNRHNITSDHKTHITIILNRDEANDLIKAKEASKLNWTNFILVKSGIVNEFEIKYNKKGKDSKISKEKFEVFIIVSYSEGLMLQKAKGNLSWREYVLSLIGVEPELPYIGARKGLDITKYKAYKIKKEEYKIYDLKCFTCSYEKFGRCKLYEGYVLEMAHQGIKFTKCVSYKTRTEYENYYLKLDKLMF